MTRPSVVGGARIIVLVVATVAIAACGDSSGPSGAPVASASATTATTAQPSATPSASPDASGGLPATDLALARIDTIASPCEMAEGLGLVWVTSYARSEVVALDPATNEVVRTFAVPQGPCGVTVGFDAVWVSGGTQTVARIDPETGDVGRGPVYLAVHDGRVWVANGLARSVSVLDAASGDPVAQIAFETGVHGLASAAGSIWVLDLHGPRISDNLKGTTMWRLDPAGVDR